MSWVAQRYSDISPVTLQVVGGAMSSSLYCQQVEGLSQVESFLVELFRCKVCQFTCGLKTAIGSHFLLRHHPPALTCLTGPDGQQVSQEGAEPESPYRLSLDGESKQSDEDEEFLLYDMLGGMSPPTCDISTEEGLQVAHTCEVSTLFEESSMFPLKGAPMELSCPTTPPCTQEQTDQSAQSAHLMTLGLCRISSVKPPPADGRDQRAGEAPPPGRLPCPLCPLTLPSERLLDVHVRSHRAAGGFGCSRCGRTADSWEVLEPHFRRRCRRGRRRKRRRSGRSGGGSAQVSDWPSDRWRAGLTAPQDPKRAELPDSRPSPIGRPLNLSGPTANQKAGCDPGSSVPSLTSLSQSGSSQVVSPIRNEEQTGLTCSLCHRKFSSKLTLRRHLGVHGAEKPFSCPHCPYSSRLKASLRQHLRTHTGEKPFRCAECPYASIDRSSLLRHSRTHSQVKPYRCQLCGYSSIQKKSLDLHARRHHTGEVFPCQQCEYSSPDRQLLLKHTRRRHAPSLLPAV
ncbi:zinc finger protein Xfin isoform X1 [Poecilia latipinna]|uniref:Zinc finger protein 782-like n=1 Tax=Poecilia latipinna TaxID=48699 RepID=A0A3B3UV54_9TELE|nr:PREDICTED: zinc finger protein Xfin-like isoform X1 [Poecilia latipinna]XP_014879878.1 PREDICTED: zinc finger protein Xfin-like isoform X1 [Poecilia latipinna]XP_014879879.1 PREDICTED: zinc finger protein Xfin-like isoform X1 [Poecilia latipinna]